jgi:hypothetical protein
LLDPVDALIPEQDLIALYTRTDNKYYQIRMDFLDMEFPYNHDIYIPIDTNPGGSNQIRTSNNGLLDVGINWEYLIFIPASGNVVIVNSQLSNVYGMELLIFRDNPQDNIVLSFNQKAIPEITSLTKIQVIITPPNQDIVADLIKPIYIEAPSPSRVKVLFAFWNTFSASTPAETLRSWAGAHSGPISSRHGLKYLLDAADNTKTPVVLLDLLKPETVSALDYLDVLPKIDSLFNGSLLLNENNDLFCGYYDYAKYIKLSQNCLVSPSNSIENANISEILLECKSSFISQGLLNSPNPIILGGDFSNSLLGDPVISTALFTYINYHPWIQVLSRYDTQNTFGNKTIGFPSYFNSHSISQINYPLNTISEINSKHSQTEQYIYSALLDLPKNKITDLAWQVYASLSHPSSSELLPLSANYIGQIGHILAAAEWVDQPFSITTCNIDLDYDGENECILANKSIFLTIEPKGAYIPYIFSNDKNGAHQIVGPTWEFILGLADPSTWDLSLGVMSDPGQIPGAFADNADDLEDYKITLLDNEILFESDISPLHKSFKITNNDILVNIQDSRQSSNPFQIPFVLDPWIRYTAGWGNKYISTTTSQGIQWGIKQGLSIELHSNTQIQIYPFNATHNEMAYPEDPNFDYSRGHYLPYPMALSEIYSTGVTSVDIVINP